MGKPEALRLAALWEKQSHGYALTPEAKTAAELRRLHAENALLHERHRFDNGVLKELLEALKIARPYVSAALTETGSADAYRAECQVDIAIARAEGEPK